MAKERNDISTTLSYQNSLENVDKFVYLGSTILHNGNLTPEQDKRIEKAANAYNRLVAVMRHKSIKIPTKTAIYQAAIDFIVWLRKLEHHRRGRETTSSVSHQMPKKNSWRLLARPRAK